MIKTTSGNESRGYSPRDVDNGRIFSAIALNLKDLGMIGLKEVFKLINGVNGLDKNNSYFTTSELEMALHFSKYLLNLNKAGITNVEIATTVFKMINGIKDEKTTQKYDELGQPVYDIGELNTLNWGGGSSGIIKSNELTEK